MLDEEFLVEIEEYDTVGAAVQSSHPNG